MAPTRAALIAHANGRGTPQPGVSGGGGPGCKWTMTPSITLKGLAWLETGWVGGWERWWEGESALKFEAFGREQKTGRRPPILSHGRLAGDPRRHDVVRLPRRDAVSCYSALSLSQKCLSRTMGTLTALHIEYEGKAATNGQGQLVFMSIN